MDKVITGSLVLFALMMTFVVYMNFFVLLTVDDQLNQVDAFLTKKVSVHRGFTPDTQSELHSFLSTMGMNPNDFDFSGSTTDQVPWGETATVRYNYQKSLTEKAFDYLHIPHIQVRPRNFYVTVIGR
ncbi:MAG TPA: hypothetical protein VJ824_15985 [Bacillota bacterium]|nr:hypothetical protein [Bacillota bacterium]